MATLDFFYDLAEKLENQKITFMVLAIQEGSKDEYVVNMKSHCPRIEDKNALVEVGRQILDSIEEELEREIKETEECEEKERKNHNKKMIEKGVDDLTEEEKQIVLEKLLEDKKRNE